MMILGAHIRVDGKNKKPVPINKEKKDPNAYRKVFERYIRAKEGTKDVEFWFTILSPPEAGIKIPRKKKFENILSAEFDTAEPCPEDEKLNPTGPSMMMENSGSATGMN